LCKTAFEFLSLCIQFVQITGTRHAARFERVRLRIIVSTRALGRKVLARVWEILSSSGLRYLVRAGSNRSGMTYSCDIFNKATSANVRH
jgi:hypothetical protein